MLDEAAARARFLASFGPAHPPIVVTGCTLDPHGNHWLLTGNTEAWVLRGELRGALVGVGAWAVDRHSGAIEAFATLPFALDALEDRHDEAEAGGRVWVVRPAAEPDAAAIVRLRQLLGGPPAQARALVRGRPWLQGPRRLAARAQAALAALGLPVELALVDDAGGAVELLRIGAEDADLLGALRRLAPA